MTPDPDGAAQRMQAARSAASPDDLVELYRGWAEAYDDDVFGELGFTGSERIADLLAEQIDDRSSPVLDLGCGTGAVGVRLERHGFTTVDGVDISAEMLAVAAAKQVYRHHIVADLNADLSANPAWPERNYAASVSAGTFTTGHVGADRLPAVLAVHRLGATVAWVIAASMWRSFESAADPAGLEIVSAELEPVRRGGDPESVMLIGRVVASGTRPR